MKKPIRIFYSTLSNRFYATQHYREADGVFTITGEKYDVTSEIGDLVTRHEITFKPVDKAAPEMLEAV